MYKTFSEIKLALAAGKTVEDILKVYLDKIEERKALNAFVEVFEESALEQAKKVDEKLKNGTAGRLAGMVIGLKDNICYKDHKVSASSKMLDGFESIYSATVVERLLAEDAIIIGRLNCDEFAMGSSNENSYYGPVKNALNEDYVPGGSSGGSASAVAAGLCTASLGSDTGGSIRQPASYTGTIGLKPTYGRVSRYGLIAYASSFDQISPLANDIHDIALLMEVISGNDENDNTSSTKEVPSYVPSPLNKKLRIACIQNTVDDDGLDTEVKTRIEEIIKGLESDGHTVETVPFSYLDTLAPTYYILTAAEASSNLSRYDGVHFGYRSEDAEGLEDLYINSRKEGFGKEVQRRIMIGNFVLTQDHYEEYYSKAQKVRRLIQNEINGVLKEYDLILMPTTPSTAYKFNAETDPVQIYLQDRFTVIPNLTGHPAISLPLGKHSNGMPFGLQLIGEHFGEKEMIDVSAFLMNQY